MKITNSQSGAMNAVNQDQPLELRKGETYQAIVKEKKSANEAVVQIRGKEVSVKTDGPFPAVGETVSLTIQGQDADGIKAKVVDSGKTGAQTQSGPTGTSVSSSSELYTQDDGQIAKLLADKGIPLTRETAGVIRQFMETAPGTVEEKLDSLRTLLRKGIEVTDEQLQAVHQALHGEPLTAQVDKLLTAAKAGGASDAELRRLVSELRKLTGGKSEWEPILRQLVQKLQAATGGQTGSAAETASRLAEALRLLKAGQSSKAMEALNHLLQNGGSAGENAAGTGIDSTWPFFSGTQESESLGKWPASSNSLSGLLDRVNTESSLSSVVYEIKDQLLGSSKYPEEKAAKWEQTFSSVRREQFAGRTEAARKLLQAALQTELAEELRNQDMTPVDSPATDLDAVSGSAGAASAASAEASDSLTMIASRLTESIRTDNYDLNSELASLGLSSKTLIVTQVTARLSQAANEFRTLKREISRNLDNLMNLTVTSSKTVHPQAKALLESSIDLLDKAILKSDITMLTDMGTEKRLLQASGQLAAARKQLMNGDTAAAREIFDRVKTSLDTLNWKPTDVKVRHMLMGETDAKTAIDTHKLSAEWEKLASSMGRNDGSARHLYEGVRSLGLNRDSEAAQWLANSGSNSSGQGQQSRQAFDQNIKSILLKLAQDDSSPVAKQAEQALQNLTGQQLLNKTETGSSTQSMMLQIPVPLTNQIAPVNVFVQSRKEGEKMDWENCSLYFALETQKLGSLGIQIMASDRNLAITMKNDRQDFKQLMEPLVSSCKEKLQEIGYRVSQIQYSPLTIQADTLKASERIRSKPIEPSNPPTSFPVKGFDFKV
ncbi:hypothetical protein [Gorillibacterium timonense]|uniref:hypothetical protein n=1 Tax=Gorillibacterium timonense TaxID=1689269 RepID=UPI00071CD5FE|nr:hypothetical protein [Gorillibacterium timonense]